MSIDLPIGEVFTVEKMAELTINGDLIAVLSGVKIPKPINDAQLDILVAAFDDYDRMGKSLPFMKDGMNSSENKNLNQADAKNEKDIKKGKPKRNWDDDNDDEKEQNKSSSSSLTSKALEKEDTSWGRASEVDMQRSLRLTLLQLTDTKGLSEVDYQNKVPYCM